MQCLCHDPSIKSSVHVSMPYWCHDASTSSSGHASIHYWCQDLQKSASVRNSVMQYLCHDPSTKLSVHGSIHNPCHDPSTSASVHGSMQCLCHDPQQNQVPMLQYTVGVTTFQNQQMSATPNAVLVSWPLNKIKRPWFNTLPSSWPVNNSMAQCRTLVMTHVSNLGLLRITKQ